MVRVIQKSFTFQRWKIKTEFSTLSHKVWLDDPSNISSKTHQLNINSWKSDVKGFKFFRCALSFRVTKETIPACSLLLFWLCTCFCHHSDDSFPFLINFLSLYGFISLLNLFFWKEFLKSMGKQVSCRLPKFSRLLIKFYSFKICNIIGVTFGIFITSLSLINSLIFPLI